MRAFHINLGKHGKCHAVVLGAKGADLFIGSRFLMAEIIGWKAQNDKPPGLKPLIKCFKPGVLRCKTALAGGVHH